MTEPSTNLRETIPLEPIPENSPEIREEASSGSKIGLIIGAVLLVGLIITGLVFLLQPGTDTARVRDVFIIFMSLEFLLMGIVMIVLIVQIARLTLLLQNEIKPILDSTNETANTLKGTAAFLSEHLVEPVFKLNQYLAGLNRIVGFFKTGKK
jgi:membrane protein implicated in regulation of membrane protease activity